MTEDDLRRVLTEIADAVPPSQMTFEELEQREPPAAPPHERRRPAIAIVGLVAAAACIAVVGALLVRDSSHPDEVRTRRHPATTSTTPDTTTPDTTRTPAITADDVLVQEIGEVTATISAFDPTTTTTTGREVATRPVVVTRIPGQGSLVDTPVFDGDLATDGTAYLVEHTVPADELGVRPGGSRLIAIDPAGTERIVLENVRSVRVSPDDRTLAVTIISPDGDDPDRDGTHAVRLIDVATGATTTLWSASLPLDDSGQFTTEIATSEIEAWTPDGGHVVISQRCCDSGSVMAVPLDGSGDPETWPAVRGDSATTLLGFAPNGDLLVHHDIDSTELAVPMEVLALNPVTGEVSGPLTTEPGNPDGSRDIRYDLIGTKVLGTLTDRGRAVLALQRFGELDVGLDPLG